MKRSELKRTDSLTRSTPLKRVPFKRKSPRQTWSEARQKVDNAALCRNCSAFDVKLEAAHVISRAYAPGRDEVKADEIVPLCPDCHRLYDEHQLDLLPKLTAQEQANAVLAAGGILNALQRVTGGLRGRQGEAA